MRFLSLLLIATGLTAQSPTWPQLRYRMIGPNRGGRVTAVAGVRAQPYTFYFGGVGGGVWKTTDAGRRWRNVTDGIFAVGSVGAIDVAESDPAIVYVGTGSEAIRSNVSIGDGVWKSTDAGRSWTHVGLPNAGQIGAVAIDPRDANTVFVAALGNPFARNEERGVFRTTDGGRSWQRVLFLSDSTGAVDVHLAPGNPRIVFASMWRAQRTPWTIISGAREGGIYRSTDGGDTWQRLGGGLPSELVGKSHIALTPADPQRVYVLIEAKPGGGLYRSDDGGEHFRLVNAESALLFRPFYYTNVVADPKNADVVYVNDETFWKSTDGGKSFTAADTPHGDNHTMWINPDHPELMIQANDGGANVSVDGGATWSTQYNQPTAEIYQVAVDSQWPYRIYGAQQDENATVIVPSLPPVAGVIDEPSQTWQSGPGCETGPAMPHPTNPDTIYGACKGQFSRLDLRTGQEKNYWLGAQFIYGHNPRDLLYRFQRVSPMEISPHDARTIYFGSQYVHRTRDEGVTWERISPDLTANPPEAQVVSGTPITRDVTGEEFYSTLYAIRESPLERGVIWAGANDGPVHITRDDGRTWKDVTPPGLPPGGRVQTIEPSPHRKGAAYVAVLRYLLGDFRPYLYATEDYGAHWRLLTDGTNGIPANWPTRVVREDPLRPRLLYAGTEFGMFLSFDDGAHWQPFQQNLPATPVTDVRIARRDLVLSTQGRGFWILDDLSPLEQLPARVAADAPLLFKPRDAVRWRYERFDLARDPSAPEYPPLGATIDFIAPGGTPRVDVLDARGQLVRALEVPHDSASAAPDPLAITRVRWDLRWPGPVTGGGRRRAAAGPLVAPGTYTVRLTAGGRTLTQPLVVRADPRALRDGVTPADLAAQEAHNLRVRDRVSDAYRLLARVDSARGTLPPDGAARLDSIRARLVTAPGRYQQPMLIDQLEYLYGMTTAADQRIGRDAVERLATLERELAELTRAADALLGASRRD